MLLENIFGKEIYTQNESVITTGNKSFTLYSSNYHYELYLKNSYIKYSSLTTQMAVIIVAGTFFGAELDKVNKSDTPIYTIILSLISIF